MELIRYGIDERFVVPKDTENMLRQKGYKGRVNATYHEVVDWFESKGIRVFAHYYLAQKEWVYVIEDFKRLKDNAGYYKTREQALNAAILKAIEMI